MVRFRMAWRETRATPGRYLFFLLAVAVGVAALVGVKGFGISLERAILGEARTLIAADLQVTTNKPPTEEHLQAMDRIARERGLVVARVTELNSLAALPAGDTTALVDIKAVTPGVYPLYGALVTEPPGAAATLGDDTVLVAPELLDRLDLPVGARILLGRETYTIAGLVRKEPDRINAPFSLGPRVLMSATALERSGLVVPGSRARHAFLVKVPPTQDSMRPLHTAFRQALGPDYQTRDYLQLQPQIQRVMDRVVSFLSLVSLLALVAGGLGVAHTTRAFLQQKLDTVAVLKCLGARSRTIIGVYLVQALGLGLLGAALGAVAGFGVQAAMPAVIGPLLQLSVPLEPAPGPILQGLAIGTVLAGVFALVPLLAVSAVPPNLVFRRDMAEREGVGGRLRRDEVAGAGVAAVALGLVAAWQAGSWRWGLYFFAGLTAAAAVLGAAAWAALRLVRRAPASGRLEVRHGLLNLYRPGSQAVAVVLALGLGVTSVATVYLLQSGLLGQLQRSSPGGTPNLVMIGIQSAQAQDFAGFLRDHPAVAGQVNLTPLVPARLVQVDGRGPRDPVPQEASAAPRALTREGGESRDGPGGGPDGGHGGNLFNWNWTLTWAAEKPARDTVVAGRWWAPAEYRDRALVSLEEDAARRIGARVGSEVVFQVDGRQVRATVASLRQVDWGQISTNFYAIFSPGALDGATTTYTGFVRTDRARQGQLLRQMVERFPGVTAFDIGEILETVQSVLDRVGLVVRFVSGFAIAAGLMILAGGIAATKFRRIREAAIFRTLGATRRRVAAAFAVEYAVLGLVAGLMGALLAHVIAGLVFQLVFELDPPVNAGLLTLAPAVTAFLTVLTGTLAAWDVLNQKPLAVLRGE